MAVRWTCIDPHCAFNPLIGFQTVLIAMIGGATTWRRPVIAAIALSLLSDTLRLNLPYAHLILLGVLLVEQNVRQALGVCDHAYILGQGRVVAQGEGCALLAGERIRKSHLGL